jgi:hypothetical protein
MVTYKVFVRNWWHRDAGGRLVPDPGARKHTLATRLSEAEALAMCAEYRARHEPGPLSRKAEYERERP